MTETRVSILVIEDEFEVAAIFKARLEYSGFAVETAATGHAGLDCFRKKHFDVVLSDIRLPDLSGEEILKTVKAINEEVVVLLVTGYATLDASIEAMKLGAEDYIPKPPNFDHLILVIGRALENRRVRRELEAFSTDSSGRDSLEQLKGGSEKMHGVYRQILKQARHDNLVLINGETGTGKELAAQAIHASSTRKRHPFLAINCGAISESLLESELFGYVPGAFTGAVETRNGIFKAAGAGTVFLDEIEAASPHTQTALLRILDRREVTPLGSSTPEPFEARILVATNRDLEAMVAAKLFREDLFFRLIEGTLTLPPLRERVEDISLLANHFFEEALKERDVEPRRLSPQALTLLTKYTWPGNVRELRHLIRRLAFESPRSTIRPIDLPPEFLQRVETQKSMKTLEEQEREALVRALELCSNNKAEAAQMLGIGRATIYSLIKRHRLEGEEEGA